MENKICKKCNIEKTLNEFPKTGRLCKICFNEYMRLRRPKKDKIKEYKDKKICKKCNIEKDIIDFTIGEKYKDGHRNICKKCDSGTILNNYYKNIDEKKEQMNLYYKNNKDKYKKYKNINKSKIKDYINEYDKKRKVIDPKYKLVKNIRCMIHRAFNNNGYSKNSKNFDILGCTYEFFLEYIISQFEPWMTLENNGIYTGNYDETWQIDHIQPISNATTIEEAIKLNHYTNLRPLCSRKNLEKSAKVNENN
jgi:hypothetical protein